MSWFQYSLIKIITLWLLLSQRTNEYFLVLSKVTYITYYNYFSWKNRSVLQEKNSQFNLSHDFDFQMNVS